MWWALGIFVVIVVVICLLALADLLNMPIGKD